ncbi:MAG: AMP-binding protein [Candidatus Thiodiazotropha sp.]
MKIPSPHTLLARLLLWRLRTARSIARLAYRLHPRRTALIDRRGSFTYAELEERVLRLNGWMQTNGVNKGDIVFTWLPETGEEYETRLATFENGTILASFHKHLTPESAAAMIERLNPAVFIHDPLLSRSILDRLRQRLPTLRLLAIGDEYEQALSSHEPLRGQEKVKENDVFSLHMTSGTTGEPKAIGYTHRKYLDSIRLISRAIDFRPPEGDGADINMLGLPLTGPGSGLVLPTLLGGAALVMPEDFRARTLLGLIERHRVSRAFLSPSAIIDILDEPAVDEFDLSSLSHVPYGSEMMPAAKIAEAIQRFGPIFQQGYACFEALPPITWLLPHEHVDGDGNPVSREILSSVGRVIPNVDVVIRDDDFQPLPMGSTGLITVRTPACFTGYWLDPENTSKTLRDGWVVMGDVGYFDPAGYLHVLGRQADRVRKDGQWINPREIEELCHEHPAVKEACLVQNGEETALVVSLRQGWQDDAAHQIEAHLQKNLSPDVLPDQVRVIEEMPRSFLNKILRREVRAMLSHTSTGEMGTVS